MPTLHAILNNAYVLFSFAVGVWAAVQAGRDEPLTGGFWGALALNTALAGAVLGLAVLMALTGLPAARGVYYLYGIYFVIVMPGTFALLRGRDDRTAALMYGIIAFFSGAAATRVPLLTQYP